MGFIEETGAAQYYRDAKILTIYEGTTAIQANDLVGRKTARDGGQTAKAIAAQIAKTEARAGASATAPPRAPCCKRLTAAREAFERGGRLRRRATPRRHPNAVFAGIVPYLMLAGNLMAGWQLARALLVAERRWRRARATRAFMQGQDRHRALLRRPHPQPGARRCATPSSRAPRASPRWRSRRSEPPAATACATTESLHAPAARPAIAAPAGHRLAAVHHQQPEAGDRAVQGRRRRLDAGAQRAPGRAARRVAGRDHRDAGRLEPRPPRAAGRAVRDQPDRAQEQRPARARHGRSCAKYKVPIVITSLGARTDVNDAVHSYGGVVLHDIINNTFAQQGDREGRRRPDRGGGRRRRPCRASRARSR